MQSGYWYILLLLKQQFCAPTTKFLSEAVNWLCIALGQTKLTDFCLWNVPASVTHGLCCASVPVCASKKRSCKPSSLVVPRWSQKWYRGTSWFWFQSSCRKAGPFSMSALRWGRKLSCLIEKIPGHYMELLKIRKTRLSKDFHQWATFAFPLILRQVAFLKSENSVTHMYSNE